MSILLNEQEHTAYRITSLGEYIYIAYDEAVKPLKLGRARRVYG